MDGRKNIGCGTQKPDIHLLACLSFPDLYFERILSAPDWQPHLNWVCVEAQCNLFWLAFLLAPTLRRGSPKGAERGNQMSG